MGLAGAEKSQTTIFFVVSQLLIVLTLYSLFDEGVVRRPWKHFQAEFNQLEMNLAEDAYAKAEKTYKANKTDEKIRKLNLDLENAIIAKESDAFEKLEKEHKALGIKFYDDEQGIKFNKSIVDAYYYEYKHAFQTGHDFKAKKDKYEALELNITTAKKALKKVGLKLKALSDKIKSYDDKIATIEDKIIKLNKPLERAQKTIDNIKVRQHDIAQVVVEDYGIQGNIYWGRVDRCQTCHIAVDKPGYENVVKKFGLTVVKDEKSKKELISKKPAKRGRVITEAQKKHFQSMYGTHPLRDEYLKTHDVNKFGCTSCHSGNGRAVNIKGMHFGEEAVKKADHKHGKGKSGFVTGVFGHEDKAHAFHHHAVEPLLVGKQKEANCLSCHNGQLFIPQAATLTKGINLFVDLGCQGCHLVKGYDKLYKAGPDLNRVAHKVKKEWLVDWIKNPKQYMPNSRMPNFNLADDEAIAVASFLLSSSQDYKLPASSMMAANIENGKKVFDTVGCRGCHSADSDAKTYAKRSRAPNLSRIAAKIKSKDWVYNWIKNPKNYSKHSRMPSLRLSNQEASNVTAYLMSLTPDYSKEISQRSASLASQIDAKDKDLILKGKKVVTKRGCYSCHNLKGFENMDRIGPELTAEALKESFELDFGDSLKKGFSFDDAFGNKVLATHKVEHKGEASSHFSDVSKHKDQGYDQVTNIVSSWQAWIRNKLKYPMSIYNHERAELKMPNFDLSDDELDSLMAFLKGLQKREIPVDYDATAQTYIKAMIPGQKLVAKYNCTGCHSIQNFGGDINDFIKKHEGEDKPQFYPPSLEHVGEKVRPEWLYSFLKKPTVYRPAMQTRMPSFGFSGDELNTLIRYFAGMSKVDYQLTETQYTLQTEHFAAAKVIAGPEAYNCFSCHLLNGKAPGEDRTNWAPDWRNMKARLQYDFIPKWIKNPAKYQKFAVMPGFLKTDDEAHPDYVDGKAEKQLEILRDFILSEGE
jgi:cytochrome c2